MTNFALIGAAGFVAPRHMKAIKAVGGDLKVAFDPNDSVGVIDSYFPDAHFFTEFERLLIATSISEIAAARRKKIDYVSICHQITSTMPTAGLPCGRNSDAICESRSSSIRGTLMVAGDQSPTWSEGLDRPPASATPRNPSSERKGCRQSKKRIFNRPDLYCITWPLVSLFMEGG